MGLNSFIQSVENHLPNPQNTLFKLNQIKSFGGNLADASVKAIVNVVLNNANNVIHTLSSTKQRFLVMNSQDPQPPNIISVDEAMETLFPLKEGFVKCENNPFIDDRNLYTFSAMPEYSFSETSLLTKFPENALKNSQFLEGMFPYEQLISDLKKLKHSDLAGRVMNQARVLIMEYRKREWQSLGIAVDRAVAIDPLGRWEVRLKRERKPLSEFVNISGFTEDINQYFFLEKYLGIELLGSEQKPCKFYVCGDSVVTEPKLKNQLFLEGDISQRHKNIIKKMQLPEGIQIDLEETHVLAESFMIPRSVFLDKVSAVFPIEMESPHLSLSLRAIDQLAKQDPNYWKHLDLDGQIKNQTIESLSTALWFFAASNIRREVTKKEVFNKVLDLVRETDLLGSGKLETFNAAEFCEKQLWDKSRVLRSLYRLIAQEVLSGNVDYSATFEELDRYLDENQDNQFNLKKDGISYSQQFHAIISDDWNETCRNGEVTSLKDQIFVLRWKFNQKRENKEITNLELEKTLYHSI